MDERKLKRCIAFLLKMGRYTLDVRARANIGIKVIADGDLGLTLLQLSEQYDRAPLMGG